MKKYRVTCLACGRSNVMSVVPSGQNQYMADLNADHEKSGVAILSARFRGDMQWGFECLCHNDSRLSRQELPEVKKLVVSGSQQAIDHLVASLQYEDDAKFSMVEL